ncbi:hypothetical protein JTB14_009080 [Gonioctena quinquepunctata]|nr:hypothetical protein JTB14_009080 [Gonioctena quinquepunctata]
MKFANMKLKYILLLFYIGCVSSGKKHRIIGGADCEHKYGYMVSLRKKPDQHACGGTLLNDDWVLTAAHCNKGLNYAVIGKSNANELVKPVTVQIVAILSHPKFNDLKLEHDIAMVKIEKLNGSWEFVKIPERKLIGDISTFCPEALSMGWGYLDDDETTPEELQCVHLPLISWDKCDKIFSRDKNLPRLVKNAMCTLAEEEKDTCKGDSGGPILCGDIQYGLVSWGLECAGSYPGVYTRLDRYLDFILDTQIMERSLGVFTGPIFMFVPLMFALLLHFR